jgi:two-component sensor histidine kinase
LNPPPDPRYGGTVSETTDRTAAAESASAPSPDFRAVFQAAPAPMLLIAVDPPRFTIVAVNRMHAMAFRTTREALVGRGLFEVFPEPPDPVAQAFMDTIRQSLERTLASRRPDEMPVQRYAVAGPEGPEDRYWGATQTPIADEGGRITHILSTVRDVTAEVKERQTTEARALLMREVDHRARNALTVVQAILRLTNAESLAHFKEVAVGRVEALARAQTSLARRRWEGADLADVVRAELAALAFAGQTRLEGPPVLLPAEKVQAMSMILHELATNAAKYGALSLAAGVVTVAWQAEAGRLTLAWRETGGPSPKPAARAGFGSRMIRQLARQLGGQVRYDWREEGLCVEITAAL